MKQLSLRWIHYMGGKADKAIDALTKELADNRAILNWMYCLAYLALIFFCVHDNKESQNAAIYATAGIVGTIFSAWVIGTSYEKVQTMRIDAAKPPPQMSDEEQENAAGD